MPPFLRLNKAGHSENVADHVVVEIGNGVTPATQRETASSNSPSNYTPKPGDVVEIGNYCGYGKKRGIVFYNVRYPTELAVKVEKGGWNRLGLSVVGLKRIGFASKVCDKPLSTVEINHEVKAYFANQKNARPQFKVGDRVKIARKPEEGEDKIRLWVSNMDYTIGCYGIIKRLHCESSAGVAISSSYWNYPLCCLEPA